MHKVLKSPNHLIKSQKLPIFQKSTDCPKTQMFWNSQNISKKKKNSRIKKFANQFAQLGPTKPCLDIFFHFYFSSISWLSRNIFAKNIEANVTIVHLALPAPMKIKWRCAIFIWIRFHLKDCTIIKNTKQRTRIIFCASLVTNIWFLQKMIQGLN